MLNLKVQSHPLAKSGNEALPEGNVSPVISPEVTIPGGTKKGGAEGNVSPVISTETTISGGTSEILLVNDVAEVESASASGIFGTIPGDPSEVPLAEGVAGGRGRHSNESNLLNETPSNRGRHSNKSNASPKPPYSTPKHITLYNPRLQPHANDLRKRMTKAEVYLWKYLLRAGQMNGYTFNRQRPVLRYIADFMCKPLNLIIEVDGSIHDNPDIHKHDTFRQSELEACGFTVIRFTNKQVLYQMSSVKNAILEKIMELELSQQLKIPV